MKSNAAGVQDLSPAAVAFPTRSAKRQGLRWFVRAPARMALDCGLSAVAFRLATVLLHYEGELGCFPSQERLSDDLGTSVDSVQRYLRELELYGFLVVEKRGRRNNYRLEPIYEAPIGHGSIEEKGQLEVENRPRRQPPSPRTLRSRPLVAKSEEDTCQSTAPVPSIQGGNIRPQYAALVRSIEADDRTQPTAPGRPVNTAPVRCIAAETPHECGTNKNHSKTRNEQQQDASGTNVVEDMHENDDVAEAVSSLQRVGVNVVTGDLGVHAGRGRRLLHLELLQWVSWVQSARKNGIVNKPAFAASKVRKGFTLGDIFPDFTDRAARGLEEKLVIAQKAEAEEAAERVNRERSRHADALIASLDVANRQDLRAKALRDPAVRLGRNVSPDMFDRIVSAVERRLVLDETPGKVRS